MPRACTRLEANTPAVCSTDPTPTLPPVTLPARYQHRGQAAEAALSPQERRVAAEPERHQAAFAPKAWPQHLPAGLAASAQQQLHKRARGNEAAVAALALEQRVPQYAVGRQWGHASAALGGGDGGGASRALRPFTSLLLAPARALQPPAAAALDASSGLGAELRWALLPGGPAGGHGAAAAAAAPERQQAQQGAGAEPAGTELRYFAGRPPPPGSSSASSVGAAPWWRGQYEQLLQQRPEDEQLWLSYAVRHAVEAGRAGGGSGGGRGSAAAALAPGARCGGGGGRGGMQGEEWRDAPVSSSGLCCTHSRLLPAFFRLLPVFTCHVYYVKEKTHDRLLPAFFHPCQTCARACC